MEHFEMAELLSKKAGVSLEDARRTLEENDWDILDAMVALERRNRTEQEPVTVDRPAGEELAQEPQPVKSAPKRDPVFTNGFAQIWHYVKRLARLSVETSFDIIRKDKTILSVPVLVLVILAVSCFWVTVPALILAMFVGCRYQFRGKRGAEVANRAMDKLGDVVENIKDSLDE